MSGNYLLETHSLCKEFSSFKAVTDVNLRVRDGSIHTLIGPNGAGKATVFNLLTKFAQPSTGATVSPVGDITTLAPTSAARLGIVRSFQISAIFPDGVSS